MRGVHVPGPQAFARPPPPQLSPAGQEPHDKAAPQPSSTSPHVAWSSVQVFGVHETTTSQVPCGPQVWPGPQLVQALPAAPQACGPMLV